MNRLLIFLIAFMALSFYSEGQIRMSAGEMSYRYNEDHDFIVNEVAAIQGKEAKAFLQFILNSSDVKISDYSFS